MREEHRPLSDLVAQGWEVAGFSSVHTGACVAHTVLLKKQRQHKILLVQNRPVLGLRIKELDV